MKTTTAATKMMIVTKKKQTKRTKRRFNARIMICQKVSMLANAGPNAKVPLAIYTIKETVDPVGFVKLLVNLLSTSPAVSPTIAQEFHRSIKNPAIGL